MIQQKILISIICGLVIMILNCSSMFMKRSDKMYITTLYKLNSKNQDLFSGVRRNRNNNPLRFKLYVMNPKTKEDKAHYNSSFISFVI